MAHAARDEVSRVCEIGAGANPHLPLHILKPYGLEYECLDTSEEELLKAPKGYVTRCADISAPDFVPGPNSFDLVVSKWLLEHVTDARQTHINTRRLLRTGGLAIHLFPTLYDPMFVLNYALAERVSRSLLLAAQPRRRQSAYGKFPARYEWCRGPTARQFMHFESCGFAVEEYVGFFGHLYFSRVETLQRLVDRMASFLVAHPTPALTSFAVVVLRAVDPPRLDSVETAGDERRP